MADWNDLLTEYSNANTRWELATCKVASSDATTTASPEAAGPLELTSPLSTSIRRKDEDEPVVPAGSRELELPLDVFMDVKLLVPRLFSPWVEGKANQVLEAVSGVATLLMTTENVAWKGRSVFAGPPDSARLTNQAPTTLAEIIWDVPVFHQHVLALGRTSVHPLGIRLSLTTMSRQHPSLAWGFLTHGDAGAILSLWLHTLAARHAARTAAETPNSNTTSSVLRQFWRVVGSSLGHDGQSGCDAEVLRRWIGTKVVAAVMKPSGELSPLERVGHGCPESLCFGMSLSHLSR